MCDEILESSLKEVQAENASQFVDPSKLSIKEVCQIIHDQYISMLENVQKSIIHDIELQNAIKRDTKLYLEKVEKNGLLQILYVLTDNYLYCLEAIKDHNCDYFSYQEEKIKKKSGKIEKVKITNLVGKTTLKRVLAEASEAMNNEIFDTLVQAFIFLCIKKEGRYEFRREYLKYVHENFEDNRNYSKMKLMIENVDSILDEYNPDDYKSTAPETDANVELDSDKKGKKGKKGKKSKKDDEGEDPFGFFTKSAGDNLVKNLESSKIGQIAKNISTKMSENDFPMLKDPSQFLASLTNPNAENGLGDLIKFVMGEVQSSLDTQNISQDDLMSEASNMMGGLSKLTGIDPMKMMGEMKPPTMDENGNMDNVPDFSQFAGIFEGLGKELQKNLGEQNGKKE
jgi:hypothetical protein